MSEPRATYRVLKNEILSEAPNLVRRKVEGLLPPDLGLAIMIILSFHVGRHNTISRAILCAELKHLKISDRQLREQIKQLRRSGHLIGSAAGENGGYYLITTPDELKEFPLAKWLNLLKFSKLVQYCDWYIFWGQIKLSSSLFNPQVG